MIDLRWLRPLDDAATAAAMCDACGRVIIAHEDFLTGGFGAEVAARITENHFADLSEPVRRLGSREVRMPSAPALQQGVVPSIDTIVAEARALTRR